MGGLRSVSATSGRRRRALLSMGLAAAMAIPISLAVATPVGANGDYYEGGDSIDISLPDWMGFVPDGTPLNDMSIPGTHDSAGNSGGLVAKTQGLTLKAQLVAGIRAFDIRARHTGDSKEPGEEGNLGDSFAIHHGSVFMDEFCDDDSETCGGFGDVLREIDEFLDDHPDETILMRLGDSGVERDPSSSDLEWTYTETFEWYRRSTTYGARIWDEIGSGTAVPNLGDVRGRIVVLQNWTTDEVTIFPNESYTPYPGLRYSDILTGTTNVQDEYTVDGVSQFSTKFGHIEDHFELTQAATDSALYINYTSGTGVGSRPAYVANGDLVHQGMNERTLDYLFEVNQKRTTGVVMMDYPGSGLIGAIVAHNFQFGSASDYADEFTELMPYVLESVDGSKDADGDEVGRARARGRQAATFVRAFVKDRSVNVWALNGGLSLTVNYHDLYSTTEVGGFRYLLWGTRLTTSAVSSATMETRLQTLVDGFDDDDGQGTRRVAIANHFRTTYPDQAWSVLVKQAPGGFDNWYTTTFPPRARVDSSDGEYFHMVWGFDWTVPPVPNPPIADAGGPYTVVEGGTVLLRAGESTDADGDALVAKWDFDDSGSYDTEYFAGPVEYVAGAPGVYTVTVKVYDGVLASTASTTVTVTNAPPVIEVPNPVSTTEGNYVLRVGTFTDVSEGDNHTGWVDWGDGTQSDLIITQNSGGWRWTADHTYRDDPDGTPDLYFPVVTVNDGHNDATGRFTVRVDNVDPVQLPVDDVYGNELEEVTLTGSLTDRGLDDTHTVSVDWGDGTVRDAIVTQSQGSATWTASHTYLTSGPKQLAITASDDDGGVDDPPTTAMVFVANRPPILAPVAQITTPENVEFTTGGTLTDGHDDTPDAGSVAWDDGSTSDVTFTEVETGTWRWETHHTFTDDDPTATSEDTRTGTVSITDNEGSTGTLDVEVRVANQAPTLAPIPRITVDEGEEFEISGPISDPSPDDTFAIGGVYWGDGPIATGLDFAQAEDGTWTWSSTHTYVDDGPSDVSSVAYQALVRVFDDDGGEGRLLADIEVVNLPPSLGAIGDLGETNLSPLEGEGITIGGTFTDPGTADTHTLEVVWGDGSTSGAEITAGDEPGEWSWSASNTYVDDDPTGTSSDRYEVGVTLTDDDGASVTGDATVVVRNAAPVLGAMPVESVVEGGTVSISGTFTDPGATDTFTALVSWGDGTLSPAAVRQVEGVWTWSASHPYRDDDPTGTPSDVYEPVVTIFDDDGGQVSGTASVTVMNAAPEVAPIVATDHEGNVLGVDSDAAFAGLPVAFATRFADAGLRDTHRVEIDWGDGSSDAFPLDTTFGTGDVAANHAFGGGEWTVTVNVYDDDGGSGVATATIRVLDPARSVDAVAGRLEPLLDDPLATLDDIEWLTKILAELQGKDGGLGDKGAVDRLEQGDRAKALASMGKAAKEIEKLLSEGSLGPDSDDVLDHEATNLTLIARVVYQQAYALAEADPGLKDRERKLASAASRAADAEAEFTAGNRSGAIDKWQRAVAVL